MKTDILTVALCALAIAATGCKDDEPKGTTIELSDGGIRITLENSEQWGSYARKLAATLEADAESLLDSWEKSFMGGKSFADMIKDHEAERFKTPSESVQAIVGECAAVAAEITAQKIESPLELLKAGNVQQALSMIESAQSKLTVNDMVNNLLSVRNSLYGSMDGTVARASLAALLGSTNAALAGDLVKGIDDAVDAVRSIPEPYSSNIDSPQAAGAAAACKALAAILSERVAPALASMPNEDEAFTLIVGNYIEDVVLPTYRSLLSDCHLLLQDINTLVASPDANSVAAACGAWARARTDWALGDAFMYGPAEALGLAIRMSHNPVDKNKVAGHTIAGVEDSAAIDSEAAGFHALELLLFKNGSPRTID